MSGLETMEQTHAYMHRWVASLSIRYPCKQNKLPENKQSRACVSSSPVVKCNSLKAPPHASLQCHDPLGAHSYGSICTMQCEEGFDLIGTNMTKCSSQGSWTHALPSCQGTTTDDQVLKYKKIIVCSHHSAYSFTTLYI